MSSDPQYESRFSVRHKLFRQLENKTQIIVVIIVIVIVFVFLSLN